MGGRPTLSTVKAILDLALQFDNACTAKDDLRKAYEKCNDIPQESRALIDAFLKEGYDKNYELNLSMYGKAVKLEKQMNAKLVWLLEKYNYRSQTHIGGSSSQTHELCDVYLTEKEIHQLHLDEEDLRETLEEQARDEKEQEEKIRQKQAEDEELMLEFGVKFDSEYERIPGPAGIVQQAKMLKEKVFVFYSDGALMSTQEYMQKVVEDVGEDDDFKSGSWVSATNYVNANGGTVTGCLGDIKNFLKNGKLDQVVAIVKSCSPNVLGDLTVTMKDLSGTIPGTIHYKVIGDDGYGKDIIVGAALILANVSVFTHKPSMNYLNITMRNVVKVFRKDTVPESDSG
ncbi:transposase, MuDR, MULE transposase domain protein [Tanacetum coccineum]|uniref:Transposase, MuDR, MULE transposase domain protein n=1 Tax=Tanacetum coccineum TaxID=301880 RepID=A0ABQ5B5L5_9ASTR